MRDTLIIRVELLGGFAACVAPLFHLQSLHGVQ
jgi:hypothetical protein